MNKIFLLIVLVLCFSKSLFAQQYVITVVSSNYYYNCDFYGNCEIAQINIGNSSWSSIITTTGSFTVNGKPTWISGYGSWVTQDASGTMTGSCYEPSGPFTLYLTECDSYSFSVSGCGYGADASFTIEPYIQIISSSPTGDYCENQDISITATNGLSGGYYWFYRIGMGGSWQGFSSSFANSITFGIQDIFGSDYSSYLNQEIYFQSSPSCGGPVTNIVGPFTFGPSRPEITSSEVASSSCKDGTDAIIKINSLNRNVLSGETLTYDIYTLSDVWIAQISSNQQPSVANPIEIRGDNSLVAPFGIGPGDYKILVQSTESLCGTVTYHYLEPIANPTQVTFTSTPSQPSCYGGNNGFITTNASGGTGTGYQYSKDNGSSYQSSDILGGLVAGDYTVRVKDSKGCGSVASTVSVTQPSDITLALAVVTSSYNDSDISCVGSTDGQITVTASGGTGTLSYSRDGTTFQPSNIFNTLGAGNYTITVRDDNNCSKNSAIVPVVAPLAITATASSSPATCNGLPNGAIEVVSPLGGTGNLSFSLDGSSFQSGASFPGLVADNYMVTIRDANFCTSTINTTVSQPPAISVSATPSLVTCAGGSDGTVQITASNAVGTPTYSLNGGAFQASNTFTGLSANAYTLTVKDGNGCLGNGNVTIIANPVITGPITITTPVSCNGGSNGALNLQPGGGVGPYTFSWSNGATTEDVSGLSAANYSVTITDSKSCQQFFNRVLSQPLPITVDFVTSDFNGSGISCFGSNDGFINISSSGGNGGYSYTWSNSAITEDINGLIAGTYSVIVTDSKSCIGNQTILITQPAILAIASTPQHIACFGGNTGSISLNTTGGTSSYEYSINNGTTWQSSPTFTGLPAADYTILTRDANGCSDSNATILTSPPNLVLAIDNVTNTTCNQSNGSAIVSATGGVSSYTFNWFNSSDVLIGSTDAINNLSAGIYRVEVVDQNSCSKQQNITISSSDGPAITVGTVTPASCSNTSDGSATISITQGQLPYSILWPNSQTTETATNLAGGDYIVEVRDNANCLALQTVTVPAPNPLAIQTITQQDPNCTGSADGEIEVVAQGGNGSYTYRWNTGSTNALIGNLMAGIYTVTATDMKNCQAVQQFTLNNPPVFTINLGADEKICEGQTIVKQSDISNATYQWSGPGGFSSNQQQVSVRVPGVYTLTVINQNGCEATDNFELSFDMNLLKADFLMVSEAFVGDTIIVIDISWPVPNTVAWQFDPAAVVLDAGQDFSLIRFDDPGDYNVSMTAQLAQCASSHSQSISIIDNPNGSIGGREASSEGLIKNVNAFPNPASSSLTVDIELYQQHDAVVELYHLHSNRRELFTTLSNGLFYKTQLSLDRLQAGLYVVVVKAGNETRSVKIIKH